MHRQTNAYRRLVKDEDYFFQLKEEIDSAQNPSNVRYDFKVLTTDTESEDEQRAVWQAKAAADGRIMERNARSLCFRPCSPDYKPVSAADIRDTPKQPLTDNPKYKNALNIVPLGPQEQYAVYFDNKDLLSRSRRYCRIGEPGFIQEFKSRAGKLGSQCPSFFNSLFGRLHIVEHLASMEKVEWTDEERALLLRGLASVLECLDPSSKHFRSDLLNVFENNHSRNGDSAVGFIGMVALHDGVRTFWQYGVKKTEPMTRRVQDIIYAVSEFRKVFPEFRQRENVRRMLGTTRYDFPGTSCLLTYEDAYFISQKLCILPKNERRCFILELYLEGRCIGVVCFIGTQHTLQLKPGEYALTEAEYGLEPKTKYERKGPDSKERKKKEALDQVPTKESLVEHQRLHEVAMKLNAKVVETQEAVNKEEKSLHTAYEKKPEVVPTEAELRILAQCYQTEVEEEIYRRIIENADFLAQLHRMSEQSRLAAAEIDRRRKKKDQTLLQPEAETDSALQERTQSYYQAMREFQVRILQERPDYQANLAALQSEITNLSLTPSYSVVDQFWTVVQRSSARILGCNECKGHHGILHRQCDCLRIWLQSREEYQEDREPGELPHWDQRFVACFKCREYNEELQRQELPEDYLLRADEQLCACMETWLDAFEGDFESIDFCPICAHPKADCAHPRPLTPPPSVPGQYGYEIQEASSDRVSVAGQPDLHLTPVRKGAERTMTGLQESQRGSSLLAGPSQLGHYPGRSPFIADHDVAAMADVKSNEPDEFEPPSLEADDPRMVFKSNHYTECVSKAVQQDLAQAAREAPTKTLQTLKKEAAARQVALKSPHNPTTDATPTLNPALNFPHKDFREIMEDDDVDGSHVKAVLTLEDPSEIADLAKARIVQNSDVFETRSVYGYGKLPSFVVPFDGRVSGKLPANGVPKHYQEKVAGSNITRSQSYCLYSSPLAQGPVNMLNNKSVSRRYLQSNRGRPYTPKGTLYRLIRDTAHPKETAELVGSNQTESDDPAVKEAGSNAEASAITDEHSLSTEEISFPTGSEIAAECKDAKYQLDGETTVRTGQKVAVRITSTWIMEPTNIPVDANRSWLTKLTSADAHSSSLNEFVGVVAGQMSILSRYWKERLLENGQRVFLTTVPGRSYSDFSYSTGGGRDNVGTWSLKLGGRAIVSFLCGCCTRLSLKEAEKMAIPPTEDAYQAALQGRKAANRLISDQSVGAPAGAKMLCPSMDPPTTAGTWRLVKDNQGRPKHWEHIVWPGYNFEFIEEGQDRKFRQCVRVTNGKEMNVETLVAIQGTCSFMVTHFDELRNRFLDYCAAQRPKVTPRDWSFTGNRYPRGLLTPSWIENEGLIQRIHGKHWAKHFENMLFSLEADVPLYWLDGAKNGPLAEKYLVTDYDPSIEEAEILARVDTSGRLMRMGEEPEYQTGSAPQTLALVDGGHRMSRKTKDKRHSTSKKTYSTAEFSSSETC
ncbi:unnamed protein product [Oikopleura dioica]|uniref:Uncharacterized protein n=1 Tax=Oikopleura dioica TaxID=34765 RepID=E4Y1U3_OIKDI|nr:unnamed protein product [Oikopleura dioica]